MKYFLTLSLLRKVGVREDGSHFAIGELLDEIFDVDIGSGEQEQEDDDDDDNPDNEHPFNVT